MSNQKDGNGESPPKTSNRLLRNVDLNGDIDAVEPLNSLARKKHHSLAAAPPQEK